MGHVNVKDAAGRTGMPGKTVASVAVRLCMGKRCNARERAERMLKASAELGYQPFENAKALRKDCTGTIGLLVRRCPVKMNVFFQNFPMRSEKDTS